jgi:hypothetical protein
VYKQILQCRRSIVFAAGAGFYAALPAIGLLTLIAEHLVESSLVDFEVNWTDGTASLPPLDMT